MFFLCFKIWHVFTMYTTGSLQSSNYLTATPSEKKTIVMKKFNRQLIYKKLSQLVFFSFIRVDRLTAWHSFINIIDIILKKIILFFTIF